MEKGWRGVIPSPENLFMPHLKEEKGTFYDFLLDPFRSPIKAKRITYPFKSPWHEVGTMDTLFFT